MIPNPDFKRAPLFDLEYLRMVQDKRHGYNVITRSIQRCKFGWPRM